MMRFSDELNQDIALIKSVYDLTSYCYDYLVAHIANQALFIANYLWENEQAEQNNPNLDSMRNMEQSVKEFLDQFGAILEDYIENLIKLIANYENGLVPYGDDEDLNHAVIPFFVIKGMELYLSDRTYGTYENAPLNKNYQINSYVYLNEPHNIMYELSESAQYASEINANQICNELEYFIILEKKKLKNNYGIPSMVTLSKGKSILDVLAKNCVIKIAIIPFADVEMLHFPLRNGAAFEVEYNEWHKKHAVERAIKLLEMAIDQKVNFIVFPEYVCSPELQDAISKHLKAINISSPERLKHLLLVIAGSGWTNDSNNVSKLYSFDGRCLGTQYKYSSFSKHGNAKMMEGLTSPGKETTIIKVPRIGNIQVGICRDISESAYSYELARIFSPVFLMIPAWSPSVKIGFCGQLKTIVSETRKTNAALCNCCEAFRQSKAFKQEIGVIITPNKNGSVVEGTEMFIRRQKQICRNCINDGCLYICNFDFSVEEGKNGVKVSEPNQIFPK